MEGDKADLPCCNLQAEEREITHLTSFFSPSAAAGGTSLVVSAADIPLDPLPRRNEIRPHFDQAAPERSQQTPIYLGKIGRQAPRGCELTFRLVSQVHTSVPLPSEVAAGVCGGVVLVVKPPRSSIKTENYKVPFGNSARTTREPEPFFASTRARQRSVPGAALSLPFRTVHLNGFQASAVSAIQGPRQSG